MAAVSVRVAAFLALLLAGGCRSRERTGDLAPASEAGATADEDAAARELVVWHTAVVDGRPVENGWPTDAVVLADGVPLTRKRGSAFVSPWRGGVPRIVVRRGERARTGACGPYEVPVNVETRHGGPDLELDVTTTEGLDHYVYAYVDALDHAGVRLGLGQAELNVPGWSSTSGWFYVAPDCHVDSLTIDGEKVGALPTDRADLLFDPGGRTCYEWRRVHFPDGGGRTILERHRYAPAKLHVLREPHQFVLSDAPDQVVTPTTVTEVVRASCDP